MRFFKGDAARCVRPRRAGVSPRTVITSLVLVLGLMMTLSYVPGGNVASADPSATDWQRLRVCESGNNYAINTGNGYYGAYQFDLSTWRSVGGSGYPHQATAATQDALALRLWQQRGWAPWACASILGLTRPVRMAVPTGHVDVVKVGGATATVAGWALDPNHSSTSNMVRVTVNDVAYSFIANRPRPDVNAARSVTGQHGFVATVPIRQGNNTICIQSIGVDANNNKLLLCKVYRAMLPAKGHVDFVTPAGATATVTGWAVDPNAPSASIAVHVAVDSDGIRSSLTGTRANLARPDVNRVLGVTGSHGYRVTVPLRPGVNRVCAYGIGTAPGTNALIQCRLVESHITPRGSVDVVAPASTAAVVAGWAFDPNYPTASINVAVYVNGTGYGFRADKQRLDVNRVFSLTGQHGFSGSIPLRAGQNRVCVYAISVVEGNNALISCRDVSTSAPQGVQRAAAPPPVAASPTRATPATSAPETTAQETTAQETTAPETNAPAAPAPGTTAPATPARETAASTAPAPPTDSPASSSSATASSNGGSSNGASSNGESSSGTAGDDPTTSPVRSAAPTTVTSGAPSTVLVTPGVPSLKKGAFESVRLDGRVGTLTGWVADTAAPPAGSWVRITVNGVTHDVLASTARNDLQNAGGAAPLGFIDTVTFAAGSNELCLYEIDEAGGLTTAPIVCRTEVVS